MIVYGGSRAHYFFIYVLPKANPKVSTAQVVIPALYLAQRCGISKSFSSVHSHIDCFLGESSGLDIDPAEVPALVSLYLSTYLYSS